MPTPRINNRPSIREELAQAPQAEVLGTVSAPLTDPLPQSSSATWTGPDGGTVGVSDPPPPWELEDTEYAASDARRYVDVPESWELRWINPKLLESTGWRYWQPVLAGDPRVTVKVQSMAAPDGNIRRGGQVGDILGWMLKSWVLSRRRLHDQDTEKLTESALRRQDTLREEFQRGTYGKYVRLEETHHPTHTNFDGKSVKD